MKPSPYFYGKIESGRWYFSNRAQFDDYVRYQQSGEYQMSLEPKFKLRTTGQGDEETNWNGYYWGIIIELLHEEMGLTRNDCHEELKILFNPKGYSYKDPKTGQVLNRVVGGSTKRMGDRRFKEYCYDIRRWAMHPEDGLNLYIPEPHESPDALLSFIESNKEYSPD